MTSPRDVARFHAEYDTHSDDRIRLFRAISAAVPPATRVLYPGSYIDTDKRAAQFFAQTDAVAELIATKRRSVGLLISLYAGFISEHCTDLLVPGGTLLVNPSHGDAAMASIDPRYELSGVVFARDSEYRVDIEDLDTHRVSKKPQPVTIDALHTSGRGIVYTRSPFAYLFTKVE